MRKNSSRASPEVIASVKKVVKDTGKPYAVTTAKGYRGSITFSLSSDVWEEEDHPKEGAEVVLTNIQPTGRGWRAYRAHFRKA